MNSAIVTGACGFVGRHLVQALLDQGIRTFGTYRTQQELDAFPQELKSATTLYHCDITNPEKIKEVISTYDYDAIFHLAGIAHVPYAERNFDEAFAVNTVGTGHILEALKSNKQCLMVYVSSSEVYGRQYQGTVPYTESHPIEPSTLYGITKYSAEMLCDLYFKNWGVRSIIFRPFNHIGPFQSSLFVASDFARQIAAIEKELSEPRMSVGNLSVKRDFSDVRDVVQGYIVAAKKHLHGNDVEMYNICSGKAVTIQELLDILLSLSETPITVDIDSAKLRKNENPILFGSYQKLNQHTGWKPSIPLRASLKDILDYWRKQVQS
ncbi:MAG: SDR family NAD(P)-dependent oxidoreductase [Candidatus Auribacterota bacterium]